MTGTDRIRTITSVAVRLPATLTLGWSDGTSAAIDLTPHLGAQALRHPHLFAQARLGDWGHSVIWPEETELGAETLWLETLTAIGRSDTRAFLEWRLRHGLSLSGTAEALGLSRRMVAYYSNGEKRVPRPILLACRGWEADAAALDASVAPNTDIVDVFTRFFGADNGVELDLPPRSAGPERPPPDFSGPDHER